MTAQHSTAQHSTAQHSTAQHSTAQHSTAQHSTAQHSTAQFSLLKTKLKEIFQINQPDLDFGIYRILNSRQTQINDFLQKTLPETIKKAFSGNFEQENGCYYINEKSRRGKTV